MKKLLFLVFGMFVILASCITENQQASQTATSPSTGEMADSISMVIHYGGEKPIKTISNIPWEKGMSVYGALEAARTAIPPIAFTDTFYGGPFQQHFIKSIDSVYGNTSIFWFFCVDDMPSKQGSDSTFVAGGQVIRWYYTSTFGKCAPEESSKE